MVTSHLYSSLSYREGWTDVAGGAHTNGTEGDAEQRCMAALSRSRPTAPDQRRGDRRRSRRGFGRDQDEARAGGRRARAGSRGAGRRGGAGGGGAGGPSARGGRAGPGPPGGGAPTN